MTDAQILAPEFGAEPLPAGADFKRVEAAMRYVVAHYRDQPRLEQIADAAGLSQHHFQRLFTRWAGISPSQFMRYLTVEYAKQRLADAESVLDAALDAGLSGPGRLHDLLVAYEAVTPGEYKAMGEGLDVRYGFHDDVFGPFAVATTDRGICGLEFAGPAGVEAALAAIRAKWPGARFRRAQDETGALCQSLFAPDHGDPDRPLRLWFKGTNFQIRVWQALLRLPPGALATYSALARAIGAPGSARAVGNAVGANPIAYLIPCHRVIRETAFADTNYRWGPARKLAMIGREAALADSLHGAV